MNWDQMKKNAGYRVQLVPMACRLDDQGRKLPAIDDEWIISEITASGVRISNTRTGHTTTLGKDHVHHFTTNPDGSHSGIQRGFLTLNVQIFLQARGLWVRPNARPGEEVEPPTVEVVEKWVDLRYPSDAGLQAKLEQAGYRLAWCLDTRLARLVDVEGWEIVIEPDEKGVLSTFRVKDRPANHTLIKKRA